MQQVAQHFGVNAYVVYCWIQRNLIQARRLNQRMPYWITLTGSDEQKLQNRVRNSSRLQKAKYPQTILRKVHYETSVPYGQDRLIPIWIATLAVRRSNSVVRFQAAAEILEFFHLSKDGRHYRRIVEGFQRVFGATIFFGTEEQAGASQMIDCARFHFFDSMHLWFSNPEMQHQPATNDENVITLSKSFYDEIDQHRIPVEREVLAALANAPGVLDFYVWLVWKTFTLRGHTARIPLLGPSGLAAQLGNAPYAVELGHSGLRFNAG